MTNPLLRVDARDRAEALDGRGLEADWFLNLETGKGVFVSGDASLEGEEEEDFAETECYLRLRPPGNARDCAGRLAERAWPERLERSKMSVSTLPTRPSCMTFAS